MNEIKTRLLSAIRNFPNHRILVIGDLMLDQYMVGYVRGMSPEAPVPIVDFQSKESKLGGAANVASNIHKLGAIVDLIGVVGNDRAGLELVDHCSNAGVKTDHILLSNDRKTTCKTRIIADGKHLLRFDEEDKHELNAIEFKDLKDIFSKIDIQKYDVVILQDYDKGMLNSRSIPFIIHACHKANKKVIVDPKMRNWQSYRDIHLIKPNLRELEHVLATEVSINEYGLQTAMKKLRQRFGISNVMVTLADKGNAVSSSDCFHWIKASEVAVIDVCGAGDAVISAVALGISEGLDMAELSHLANMAGKICCEHLGVFSPSLETLTNTCKKLDI